MVFLSSRLLEPVGDPAACQVVGREFDHDLVARQDADEVLTDFSRCVSEDFVTVWKLDLEKGVGQRLVHESLDLNCFLFCQIS